MTGEIRTPARTAVIPSTEGFGCEGPPRSSFGLAARLWPAKPLLTRGSTSGSENERWRYLWGGIISQPHICGPSNKSRSTAAHSFTGSAKSVAETSSGPWTRRMASRPCRRSEVRLSERRDHPTLGLRRLPGTLIARRRKQRAHSATGISACTQTTQSPRLTSPR
jgi:hypothetical protein